MGTLRVLLSKDKVPLSYKDLIELKISRDLIINSATVPFSIFFSNFSVIASPSEKENGS